jgi:hypothetical protein
MSIGINLCKESISNAYLQAVVATARMSMTKPSVDVNSIDWSLECPGMLGSVYQDPKLDIQLKCTAADSLPNGDLRLPLKMKNYNDLRCDNCLAPRILLVVVVPKNINDWLNQSEKELLMRRCGYWRSLRGEPVVTNAHKITVSIPRNQILTPQSLNDIMGRISNGGLP